MTRYDVETEGYTVDEHGIIRDLGKFEGEPWWMIELYDRATNGISDDVLYECAACSKVDCTCPEVPDDYYSDARQIDVFEVDDAMRRDFELEDDVVAVWLWEDDCGFVHRREVRKGEE